jgi:P-type Cu+ transporter
MHPEETGGAHDLCPRCGMALEADAPPLPATRGWTCPMHPDVVADAPGECPRCGMALEPLGFELPEADPELADMTRRLWISAALTIPLFALAMGSMLTGEHSGWLAPHRRVLFEWALATPVCLGTGLVFQRRALQSLRNRSPNMFTLIGLGVAVTYVYSALATLVPDAFPASFRHDGVVPVYFESAAVIVTLVLLGQVLELRARGRTGAALRALLELAP